MDARINILSTVKPEPLLLSIAAENDVHLDMVPFIQVVDITDHNEVQRALVEAYRLNSNVIFTSASAVYAVCETPFFKKPEWDIYCLEHATQKAVLAYFDANTIKGTARNATALAEEILSRKDVRSAIFFCGDQRMDALPDLLNQGGVSLQEIVVYQTIETSQFISKDYDAILFHSPSAVNSYFGMNVPDEKTVFFAIGASTAQTIQENTSNKLIVSSLPSKEVMLQEAVQFLRNKS